MTDDLVKRGKTILSCGHEDEHGCWGVSVQFDEEQCVAGVGFVPTTIYAQYCHECATKLYYELGKDAGRVEAGLELDRIEALTAENERLREALVAEREENLWSAYTTGDVIGDEWTHLFMSDGEWLAKECGFDPRQGYYSAAAIRNAIPIAARAALGDTQ